MISNIDKLRRIQYFPLLSKDTIVLLRKDCLSKIVRAQRITQESKLADESLENLRKELNFYEELLFVLGQTKSISAYILLTECDTTKLDNDTISELISYWQENFSRTLEYENSPLNLSALFAAKVANPILFTALIHSLIKKKITAKSLLNSGILHDYALTHIHDLSYITSVYSLLKKTENFSNIAEITALCKEAAKSAGPQVLGVYSTLSGIKLRQAEFENLISKFVMSYTNELVRFFKTSVSQNKKITLSSKNLTRLQEFFAEDLLVYMFSLPTSPLITTTLSDYIQKMTIQEAGKFGQYISYSVSEDQRFALLEKFSSYLSIEQVRELINLKAVSLWILLSSKPALLNEFDEVKLNELVSNNPINLDNMIYALNACKHPKLKVYSENIHTRALGCWLENPTIEMPESVRISFILHGHTRLFYFYTDQILIEFNNDILSNLPLTDSSYTDIMDSYRIKLPKWRLLEKCKSKPLLYPSDSYAAQGYIMKALYDADTLTSSCLDIFHPENPNYSKYDRLKAKQRTLLTCLAEQNKPALQEWVIAELKKSQCYIYNSIGNVPIIALAIKSQNDSFINLFYASLNVDYRLYHATTGLYSFDPYFPIKESPLYMAASSPKCLKAILGSLPKNKLLTAVTSFGLHSYPNDYLLRRLLAYPKSLKTVLELLPADDLLVAIFKKLSHDGSCFSIAAGHYGDSLKIMVEMLPNNQALAAAKEVLHSAARSRCSESLKTVLSLYPEHERFAALKEKTKRGYNVLQLAARCPENLQAILELLPENQRLSAEKESKENAAIDLVAVTTICFYLAATTRNIKDINIYNIIPVLMFCYFAGNAPRRQDTLFFMRCLWKLLSTPMPPMKQSSERIGLFDVRSGPAPQQDMRITPVTPPVYL